MGNLTSVVDTSVLVGATDVVDPAKYGGGDLRPASGRSSSNDLWIAATAPASDLELVTVDTDLAALPLVRTTLV